MPAVEASCNYCADCNHPGSTFEGCIFDLLVGFSHFFADGFKYAFSRCCLARRLFHGEPSKFDFVSRSHFRLPEILGHLVCSVVLPNDDAARVAEHERFIYHAVATDCLLAATFRHKSC
jgi:hypothetical protein